MTTAARQQPGGEICVIGTEYPKQFYYFADDNAGQPKHRVERSHHRIFVPAKGSAALVGQSEIPDFRKNVLSEIHEVDFPPYPARDLTRPLQN